RSAACGVTDMAGHAADCLDVLGERTGVIVGHSIGGVVALAAAQLAPERVVAVGAYEAPMSWQPWWPRRSAGGVAMAAGDAAAAGLVGGSGTEAYVIDGAGHGAHVSHHAAFAGFVRRVVDAAAAGAAPGPAVGR